MSYINFYYLYNKKNIELFLFYCINSLLFYFIITLSVKTNMTHRTEKWVCKVGKITNRAIINGKDIFFSEEEIVKWIFA